MYSETIFSVFETRDLKKASGGVSWSELLSDAPCAAHLKARLLLRVKTPGMVGASEASGRESGWRSHQKERGSFRK